MYISQLPCNLIPHFRLLLSLSSEFVFKILPLLLSEVGSRVISFVFHFVGGDASLSSLVTPLESVPLGENGSHSSSGKLYFTYNMTEAKKKLILDLGFRI